MSEVPRTAQPEDVNPCPTSAVARLDDYRHRQQVREARRVFRAFEAAVWEHIRLMVERASQAPPPAPRASRRF